MKPFAFSALAGLTAGAALFASPLAGQPQPSPAAPASPPTEAVPAIGPADPNLRVVKLPNGKRLSSSAGDPGDHPMGMVRQCSAAGPAHQCRRYGRA